MEHNYWRLATFENSDTILKCLYLTKLRMFYIDWFIVYNICHGWKNKILYYNLWLILSLGFIDLIWMIDT